MKNIKLFEEFFANNYTQLNEKFVNLFQEDSEEKRRYMNDIWEILQQSYAPIGGIKGSGFRSPEDMLNIPMWKIIKSDGKVIGCVLYKDKNGRKSVACGTDGSEKAKKLLRNTISANLLNSWSERSGAALFSTIKAADLTGRDLKKYLIPSEEVQKLLPEDYLKKVKGNEAEVLSVIDEKDKTLYQRIEKDYPHVFDYLYIRKIAGKFHIKCAVGSVGMKIIKKD